MKLPRLATLPEIGASAICMMVGHEWEYGRCTNCDAKKEDS